MNTFYILNYNVQNIIVSRILDIYYREYEFKYSLLKQSEAINNIRKG